MRLASPRRSPLSVAVLGLVLAVGSAARAAEPQPPREAARPFGLTKRVPWTTSRVRGTPDPPPPYRTELAFPKLRFEEPLAMAYAPGSDRAFVAQRFGKVVSFPNDPAVEKADLAFDLKKQILGFTFHPNFERNGQIFVAYLIEPDTDPVAKAAGKLRTVHVSRLRVGHDQPPTCDVGTEQLIISWPSLYHDGCCLVFGRDGCLYISAGDGGGPDNGQGLGELSSSILRIDVDHPEGDKPYRVPRDNPFVGLAEQRGPLVGPAGHRAAEVGGEDRVGDLVGEGRGEDPVESALDGHALVRDRAGVETEGRHTPGLAARQLDADGARVGPGRQLPAQPLARDRGAAGLGMPGDLACHLGALGLDDEVRGPV